MCACVLEVEIPLQEKVKMIENSKKFTNKQKNNLFQKIQSKLDNVLT